MVAAPDVLYGEELGSNYQGQATMLSKHFVEQTASHSTKATALEQRLSVPRLFQ